MVGVQSKFLYVVRNTLEASLGWLGRVVVFRKPLSNRFVIYFYNFYTEIVKCMRLKEPQDPHPHLGRWLRVAEGFRHAHPLPPW